MDAPPLLVDCHSDIVIDVVKRRRAGERQVLERVHLPSLRRGGISAAICTVGGDPTSLCPQGPDKPLQGALEGLAAFEAEEAESHTVVRLVRSPAELRAAVGDGALALVPALEGAAPLEGDLGNLRLLHERGVRMIGLTWNTRNELAVGLEVKGGGDGLTELGREAVCEMNELGVVVDVSHLAPSSFWDVVETTSAPIVASHANARAVHDHPRNLDDEQLKAIGDLGGFVGAVLYPPFVAPHPVTIEHVLNQVEYLVERLGAERVGIGADFIDFCIEEVVAEFRERGIPFKEADLHFPEGLEDASMLGALLAGLQQRGFGPDEIAAIAGESFLRVWGEVEACATAPRA